MWSGPIHDPSFAANALAHVEANQDKYGTSARMKGMLTVAKEVRYLDKCRIWIWIWIWIWGFFFLLYKLKLRV